MPAPRVATGGEGFDPYDKEAISLFLEAQLVMAERAPAMGVDDRGQRAVGLLTKAVAIDPRSAALWRYLAAAYKRVPDAEEAVVSALQAISLDPTDATAHWIAGNQLYVLGQNLRAEPYLVEAARLGLVGDAEYLPHNYLYLLRRDEGRIDEAAAALDAWAATSPDDARPYQLKVRLLWDAGRYAVAKDAAVATLRRAPADRESRSVLNDYFAYEPEGELAVLERLLEADWSVPELHDAARRAYDRLGRYDRAVDHLQWVLVLGSYDPVDLTLRRGWLQYRMHDFAGVEQTLVELEKAYPESVNHPQIPQLRGAVARHEGRFDDALAILSEVPPPAAGDLEAGEAYARTALRRADVHLDAARPDLAEQALLGASQMLDEAALSDRARLLSGLVRVRLAQERVEDARDALAQLQEIAPGAPGEVDVLLAEERVDEAIDQLSEQLGRQPDATEKARRLAGLVEGRDGLDAALHLLDATESRLLAALDRRKQGLTAASRYAVEARTPLLLADLDMSRATLLQQGGDVDGAVAALRDALEHRPSDPFALNHLAYLFSEQRRDLDEAESLVRRALEQRPFSGVMQDTLGWVLYRRGDANGALPVLERADRYAPREPEILVHMAEVLTALGRESEARVRYEAALRAIDPKQAVHREVEAKVRGALEGLGE